MVSAYRGQDLDVRHIQEASCRQDGRLVSPHKGHIGMALHERHDLPLLVVDEQHLQAALFMSCACVSSAAAAWGMMQLCATMLQ